MAGAVALAVSAPGASAATSRHAAVGGVGTECSSAKPCSIEDAVYASAAGDVVIVASGNYLLWSGLKPPAGITIQGTAGQQRPRLVVLSSNLGLTDMTLRHVEVDQGSGTTAPAISAKGTTVDQVVVQGPYSGDCALSVENSHVRDSLVRGRSDGSAICVDALQSSNSTVLRNVTAVSGDGPAIEATAADSTADVTVDVINTIAKAGPKGIGLYLDGAPGAHARMTVSHSYYANYHRSGDAGTVIVHAGGNTGTPPLFVDAANGDYRQKAGSVTVDAGASDGLIGSFDLDGDPRSLGSAPDIGADEFVPPPPPLPPPGGGEMPPPSPGEDSGPGSDTGGGSGASGTATSGFAGVKLVSTALALKRGFVLVKLSCPVATDGRCTGATRLTARRRRAGSRSAGTVSLGRAGFSIAAGDQKRLRVRVSRAGRRLIAHRRRIRGSAATAAHDGTGLSKTTSARVTIRKGTR